MKILFLPSHYILDDHQYGSEADLAYNVVDAIARKYPESIVVTGRKNLISEPSYKVIEVMSSFQNFNMTFLAAVKFNLRYTRKAFQLLRSQRFDIVHHVRPFALGSTFNLAILLGCHKKTPFAIGAFCSPYIVKGAANHEKPPTTSDLMLRYIEKVIQPMLNRLSDATLRKADIIFAVDHGTEKMVQAKAPGVKTMVLPPGKHGDHFHYNASKVYREGAITFLSAGNFVPRKRFDGIIMAFSAIANDYPEARLILVGSGYEEKGLKSLVERLGLVEQVRFHGRVSTAEMPMIYAQSDVYVSMPAEEAFGHVYIEAMASGLPIIATETVGTTEILKGETFGRIIAQMDIGAMSREMKYFLDNPSVLPGLSSKARRAFEERYDWKVIIPQYLTAYERILAKRQKSTEKKSS